MDHEKGFDGVSTSEMHLDPQAFACPLNLSPSPWIYGTTMEMFLLFDPLLLLLLSWLSVVVCPLSMLCLWLNLFCRVWRAHDGKLQACRAFPMCSITCVGLVG